MYSKFLGLVGTAVNVGYPLVEISDEQLSP